jgi:hypothetical protein
MRRQGDHYFEVQYQHVLDVRDGSSIWCVHDFWTDLETASRKAARLNAHPQQRKHRIVECRVVDAVSAVAEHAPVGTRG